MGCVGGNSPQKKRDAPFITGLTTAAVKYGDDVKHPGLGSYPVLPECMTGKLKGIDVSAAEKMEGVVKVITAANMG